MLAINWSIHKEKLLIFLEYELCINFIKCMRISEAGHTDVHIDLITDLQQFWLGQ